MHSLLFFVRGAVCDFGRPAVFHFSEQGLAEVFCDPLVFVWLVSVVFFDDCKTPRGSAPCFCFPDVVAELFDKIGRVTGVPFWMVAGA